MAENPILRLLENSCASIRFRLRMEVLHEDPREAEMLTLQDEVLQEDWIKKLKSKQQADGWLSWNFHGSSGTEADIRQLREMGVLPSCPLLRNAVAALEEHPERCQRGLGKPGIYLDQTGLGGTELIRAATLAQGGREDAEVVTKQIQVALAGFASVLAAKFPEDVFEQRHGRTVIKEGHPWPGIYHLRLLAWTQSWRSQQNLELLGKCIQRLVDLSPLPQYYLLYANQLVAPASFCMMDFNPNQNELDDIGWFMWLKRMELLARLGGH